MEGGSLSFPNYKREATPPTQRGAGGSGEFTGANMLGDLGRDGAGGHGCSSQDGELGSSVPEGMDCAGHQFGRRNGAGRKDG